MAVLHKKRNANTKKRARLMLGMAACVFAPTALAVWYLTALLAKRQPPAALAYGALAAAAAGALCFRVLYTRSAVLKSGIDGERQAAAALRVRRPIIGLVRDNYPPGRAATYRFIPKQTTVTL